MPGIRPASDGTELQNLAGYDDLLLPVGYRTGCKSFGLHLFSVRILSIHRYEEGNPISLLAKWLPYSVRLFLQFPSICKDYL